MKTFEIVWFMLIMLLCAVMDNNNTVMVLTLCVLVVPFVLYMIAKTAKSVVDNEIKKTKEAVNKALSEK